MFDNLDDGEIVKRVWPSSQRGSILVTSQNAAPSFSLSQTIYRLQSFSKEEGCDVLCKLIESHTSELFTEAATDRTSALELSSKSGGLPLALTQIAASMLTINCTLEEYLSVYEEQRAIGHNLQPFVSPVDFRYEHNMETVWDVTLSKMDDRTTFFVGLLSFLDPDSIPELLFQAGKVALDNGKVPLFPFSQAEYV